MWPKRSSPGFFSRNKWTGGAGRERYWFPSASCWFQCKARRYCWFVPLDLVSLRQHNHRHHLRKNLRRKSIKTKEEIGIMVESRQGIHASSVFISSVLCVAMLCTPVASAQVAANPQVNGAAHFDVSPPIRDLARTISPKFTVHPTHAPMSKRQPNGTLQATAVDGALQTSTGPLVSATIGLNLLGVGNGFNGYVVPDAPTDVNLAVGDTQVVQWVNVSYAVFDKTSGAVIAGPIEGNQFWAGFGGACEFLNQGDPVILFDKLAHRWVATQETFGPYVTCIAISTTPDALGTYYRFAFAQPGFPDHAKLA